MGKHNKKQDNYSNIFLGVFSPQSVLKIIFYYLVLSNFMYRKYHLKKYLGYEVINQNSCKNKINVQCAPFLPRSYMTAKAIFTPYWVSRENFSLFGRPTERSCNFKTLEVYWKKTLYFCFLYKTDCRSKYCTRAIIRLGMYVFYSLFEDQFCSFKGLFLFWFCPFVWLVFKSDLLSRAGYDGTGRVVDKK